jgi:hypothetical protein
MRWEKCSVKTTALLNVTTVALATLLLAGCSASATGERSDFGFPPDPPAPSEPCIVGVWTLDVGDYEAQSIVYINSLEVPMEDFTLTGSQTLSVTADGLFRLDTNVTTGGNMTLPGYLRYYETTTTGLSTAEWSAGDSGTIILTDWVDDLHTTGDAPEESGLGGGVGFGYESTINATCEADRLTLSGNVLPVVSRWTRR